MKVLRVMGRALQVFALVPLVPFIFIAILVAAVTDDPYGEEGWK